MPEDTEKEREVIAALKSDSQEAFNEIYSTYARRLYSYCYKFSRTAEDAEEIVQDTFVRLWNSRGKLKSDTNLNNLIFTISHRLVINAWHKRMLDPRYITFLEIQEQVADSRRTEHAVEYDEFSWRVLSLMDKLPTTQRKIVQYAKMEDLPSKEIARRMNLSEQTVRNQLSLALKTLRSQMKDGKMAVGLLFLLWA
ncbi:MAG: RNA polymerase sigma-70 factor [Prevotella sp.]|nr:RNA polymerase sigma-70 factor [Prevotella sp.]MDY4039044.1 RNA polymerase sigma-70 factor [Prevotella sp.]